MDATDYLSPARLAAEAHLTTGQLARWRRAGTGPRWRKLGSGPRSRVQYLRADVDAWLASLPTGGGAP
jgi:predicted DNA-binding transcriptional regulator AlpA